MQAAVHLNDVQAHQLHEYELAQPQVHVERTECAHMDACWILCLSARSDAYLKARREVSMQVFRHHAYSRSCIRIEFQHVSVCGCVACSGTCAFTWTCTNEYALLFHTLCINVNLDVYLNLHEQLNSRALHMRQP